MATIAAALVQVNSQVSHQRNVIAQARRLARHYGMRITKSRKTLSVRNFGGYRIDHCQIAAGSRYNLTADECFEFLFKLVEGDGHDNRA
jgi:hypothetical protein